MENALRRSDRGSKTSLHSFESRIGPAANGIQRRNAEGDTLLTELRDLVGQLQNELQEWEAWWGAEEPPPQQQELAGQQRATAEILQPTTPLPPPITPPVLKVPAQFLPPATLPCIDAIMPPPPVVQRQGHEVQQEQAQEPQLLKWHPSPYIHKLHNL